MKENNELSDKFDQLQKDINSLRGSMSALEENLFSSSHRAQDAENHNKNSWITVKIQVPTSEGVAS